MDILGLIFLILFLLFFGIHSFQIVPFRYQDFIRTWKSGFRGLFFIQIKLGKFGYLYTAWVSEQPFLIFLDGCASSCLFVHSKIWTDVFNIFHFKNTMVERWNWSHATLVFCICWLSNLVSCAAASLPWYWNLLGRWHISLTHRSSFFTYISISSFTLHFKARHLWILHHTL